MTKSRKVTVWPKKADAMKPSLNIADVKPLKGAETRAAEPKFASAALAGSSEATNAILKSRFGGGAGAKKAEDETAKNTATTADILKKQAIEVAERAKEVAVAEKERERASAQAEVLAAGGGEVD